MLVEPMDDEARQTVIDALAACGGNQSRAAKQLGMSRGALIRRLERYGVVRPRKPD
jgi:transcriptional regulator of acetoin/glycerol metabolism